MLAPTIGVARAFRVNDRALRPLPGGQNTAWTDGRLVLKPIGFPPEHAWVCEVFAGWTASDVVRVPEPVASYHDHGWLVEGWGAHVMVQGRDLDLPTDLPVVRAASDAFHTAVADLPRPAFMDDRTDPWSFGDRVAFDGFGPQGDAEILGVITPLREALRPVRAHDQIIHGDILPNVLFAPALPPAVIDWPPYFRPKAFANAVAATDAVTFRGAPQAIFDDWADGPDWDQLLVRALLYRLGTTGWFAARDRVRGSLLTHAERARPVIDAVLARSA